MEKNQQYSSNQNSFNKVHTALKVFLENVAYIYESSGIPFDPKKNENIFIRLLLPQENFGGVDWWGIKQDKQIKKVKIEQKTLPYQNSYHIKSNNTPNIWSQVDREPKSSYQPFSNSDKPIKVRPSIDRQMEEKVYHWAMEQFQKGTRVQMVEIRKAAINWAKNKDFQGSTGWCSNFLNRYQDLKQLVKNKDYQRISTHRGPQIINQRISGRNGPDQQLVPIKWIQQPNNSAQNPESQYIQSPLYSLSDSDDFNQFNHFSVVEDDDDQNEENRKEQKNVKSSYFDNIGRNEQKKNEALNEASQRKDN